MMELTNEEDSRWKLLRATTPARIGLRRSGSSIATRELLAFQLAHAEARDAVEEALDPDILLVGLRERGLNAVLLRSSASDHHAYLARPDLGRKLDNDSLERLGTAARGYDFVFVIADGLSVLIGERPGLTSPDSLGVYLTWKPIVGKTDAERNCLSNIRREGLSYTEAAQRIFHLCSEAMRRKCTGVALKDDTVISSPALTAIRHKETP